MTEAVGAAPAVHSSNATRDLRQLLSIPVGALIVVGLVALPYLPGNYDALAVPLSAMTQLFGFTGLVLVGIGILWAVLRRAVARPSRAKETHKVEYRFAAAAVIIAAVIVLISALLAASHAGPTLGLMLALADVTWATWLLSRIRNSHADVGEVVKWGPRYLILIPLTATVARLILVPAMSESSRIRAMDNAQPLIAAIEQYRQQHGRYPVSLASLNTDFHPSIMGVKRYYYEPSGSAYNVFFEHLAHAFDTHEVIMYNPSGAQQVSSHDADLLEYSGADLELRRGYYAVIDAATPQLEAVSLRLTGRSSTARLANGGLKLSRTFELKYPRPDG